MASMENDDLIVIESKIFHESWKHMCEIPIPSVYLEKVEELKNKYGCFRTRTNQHVKQTRGSKYQDQNNTQNLNQSSTTATASDFPPIRHMRPRIGVLFTNTEGKARKNFTSFMNKLSPQNKCEILPNFIKSLIPENIPIYMDQITLLFQVQPTYHELYMEVLYEIITIAPVKAKELLEENFKQFIQEEKYKIPVAILENLDELNTSSEQLNQLCEYVKWKKQIKALIKFYIHCLSNQLYGSYNDIETIFALFGQMIDTYWEESAIVDIYLDIILHGIEALCAYYPKRISCFTNIMNHYCTWDQRKDTLKPSSKFKVLDILEIIRKNRIEKR